MTDKDLEAFRAACRRLFDETSAFVKKATSPKIAGTFDRKTGLMVVTVECPHCREDVTVRLRPKADTPVEDPLSSKDPLN